MKFVFNFGYLFLLAMLLPWIAWRVIVQGKNRRGWQQKIFGLAPVRQSKRPCIWIHAVSVGEVNLLGPLVERIQQLYPHTQIAISTTTETGFDLASQKFSELIVFFCPSDFSWAINNTISRIRPQALLLTELELWPNLVSVADARGVDVALINGRVSEKSFRGYRRIKFLVSRLLNKMKVACVQTENYADRLRELGMQSSRIQVCGNMKFDCVQPRNGQGKQRVERLATLSGLGPKQQVFLAGSTQEREDHLAIAVYEELLPKRPDLRLVLVPRHPQRCGRLTSYLADRNIPYLLRSTMQSARRDQGLNNDSKERSLLDSSVIVVDVIGELRDWWQLANVGYVGGSMGSRGGQNMIEPTACGLPTCFGPHTENFKDVVEQLLSGDAVEVVHNANELQDFVQRVLDAPEWASALGNRAREIVNKQVGATTRTLQTLSQSLPTLASWQFRASA